ncbi:hypothetical protein [Cupriavidus basilensis]
MTMVYVALSEGVLAQTMPPMMDMPGMQHGSPSPTKPGTATQKAPSDEPKPGSMGANSIIKVDEPPIPMADPDKGIDAAEQAALSAPSHARMPWLATRRPGLRGTGWPPKRRTNKASCSSGDTESIASMLHGTVASRRLRSFRLRDEVNREPRQQVVGQISLGRA